MSTLRKKFSSLLEIAPPREQLIFFVELSFLYKTKIWIILYQKNGTELKISEKGLLIKYFGQNRRYLRKTLHALRAAL